MSTIYDTSSYFVPMTTACSFDCIYLSGRFTLVFMSPEMKKQGLLKNCFISFPAFGYPSYNLLVLGQIWYESKRFILCHIFLFLSLCRCGPDAVDLGASVFSGAVNFRERGASLLRVVLSGVQ